MGGGGHDGAGDDEVPGLGGDKEGTEHGTISTMPRSRG